MSKSQETIDFFLRIGDGWHRNLPRFNKQVRMMHRYYCAKKIKFHYCWNKKMPRRACFDIITKANLLFDNLRTFTNAQWYSFDTENLLFACADRYVTCYLKLELWHGLMYLDKGCFIKNIFLQRDSNPRLETPRTANQILRQLGHAG